MLLTGQPLSILALAKGFAHWTACGLPLVLLSPFVATAIGVPFDALGTVMLSLALGTGILSASARSARRSRWDCGGAACCWACWCCRSRCRR